jgi:hypothetical protein
MAFLQRGGSVVVTIPTGQFIAVGALRGSQAQVLIPFGLSGGPISLIGNDTKTFGPYLTDINVTVSSISGSVEYVINASPALTDASGGIGAAIVSSTAPSNADGRADGTIYIQTV